MDKVTFTNISSATIVMSVPELKFRRELIPGRSVNVSRDDYDELMFDTGINGLINDHYISVSGLEENEEAEVQANPIYTRNDLAGIIDRLDITTFAKMIPTAAQAEKDTIVQLAIDRGITHPAFVKLIKQYCDVDVIDAINKKHQLEE